MREQGNHVYDFGPFRFIPAQQLLLRAGSPVPLSLKAFDILQILIRNRGYIVEKDELMREVWPDSFVEESNLTQTISVLRKALGENTRHPQYIETVPRRGYRFIASVKLAHAEDSLLFMGPGASMPPAVENEEINYSGEAQQPSSAQQGAEGNHGSEAILDYEESNQFNGLTSLKPASGSGPFLERLARRRWGVLLTVSGLVIFTIAIGVAFGLSRLAVWGWSGKMAQPSTTESALQAMRMARLTTAGKSVRAAISPDGKYVVHVVEDSSRSSLNVRAVASLNDLQIVPPAEARYYGVTISPDGNFVYFARAEKPDLLGTLYRVSLLGGSATEMVKNVESPVTFSPDGGRFAFVRADTGSGERSLMIANASGSGERKLISRRMPEYLSDNGPAWSPDGKLIAYAAGSASPGLYMSVFAAQVEDGRERQVTPRRWFAAGQVAWLEDSSRLVINAQEQSFGSFQLWRVAYPDGEARKVTNDLNDYYGVSLAKDSGALVTIQSAGTSNIWVVPGAHKGAARQITSGMDDGFFGLSVAPDGRILYSSNASGGQAIWSMRPDGTDRKRLTGGTRTSHQPSASPDGRYIFFVSDFSGSFHVWRMDTDGGDLKQLTSGDSIELLPVCSPDSQWVVFARIAGGKSTLWKVPVDGGEAVQLSDKFLAAPSVSPDGKWIACWLRDDRENSRRKLAVIPFEGGDPVRVFDVSVTDPSLNGTRPVRWTPDGRSLTYIAHGNGASNVWSQRLDGGRPVKVSDFRTEEVFNFDWSRDGRQLVCARGADINDLILISNLR